ncbi:ATP-binding protein [Corynebacterium sp. zg-331]|uniref:ATP-binding protein n=1 Tax=unclassified Corynebacterium TaxID=2624378 RepID=UPI00128D0AB5|nr:MULTISPECIES: ATP-binding protein [unclassified Corynebacterium]MBC3185085.1 ATP-binding protein [Corynebacterium sp. zg-331]MPV51585.1 AAA family ATPase [Corynebacterium sp. zg331]
MAPRNPFRPTFGIVPEVVAGRTGTVAQVSLALDESPGSPYRFTLISGARGSGKTVLLNLLEKEARERGWTPLRITASNAMLDKLTQTDLPKLLSEESPNTHRTQITGGSLAGIGSVTVERTRRYPYQESLHSLLREAVTSLDKRGGGLFLSLDELQSTSPEHLHSLTDAIQDVVRDELPLALTVAGLPFEIAELLDHPGTTFLRRAVPIPLTALPPSEVEQTLRETAQRGNKSFTDAAARTATEATQGYPYLMQLIGSVAWALADKEITPATIDAALPLVIERMGLQVHAPALRGLPEREREYLLHICCT